MTIQLFINELSLAGQFFDAAGFRAAAVRFVELVNRARAGARELDGRVFRSALLSETLAFAGIPLVAAVNTVAGRDIHEALIDVIFNRTVPEVWESTRIHSDEDAFVCNAESVSGSSTAEAAEREVRRPGYCALLNFGGSKFCPGPIPVRKNGSEPVLVASFDTVEDLNAWLARFLVPPYSAFATAPPADKQTCLASTARFVGTAHFCQGRRVYRHVASGDHYYVDNLHVGAAAHLEVFDRFGRHRGEASLDGELRRHTADPNRRLEF